MKARDLVLNDPFVKGRRVKSYTIACELPNDFSVSSIGHPETKTPYDPLNIRGSKKGRSVLLIGFRLGNPAEIPESKFRGKLSAHSPEILSLRIFTRSQDSIEEDRFVLSFIKFTNSQIDEHLYYQPAVSFISQRDDLFKKPKKLRKRTTSDLHLFNKALEIAAGEAKKSSKTINR